MHRVVDGVRRAIHVRREERATQDADGQAVDLVAHVALLTVGEAADHLLRVVHHDGAVGLDAVAVEAGLDQVVLPLPVLAVRREDPLPRKSFQMRLASAGFTKSLA